MFYGHCTVPAHDLGCDSSRGILSATSDYAMSLRTPEEALRGAHDVCCTRLGSPKYACASQLHHADPLPRMACAVGESMCACTCIMLNAQTGRSQTATLLCTSPSRCAIAGNLEPRPCTSLTAAATRQRCWRSSSQCQAVCAQHVTMRTDVQALPRHFHV